MLPLSSYMIHPTVPINLTGLFPPMRMRVPRHGMWRDYHVVSGAE